MEQRRGSRREGTYKRGVVEHQQILISALLIISHKGPMREPYLCDGLRKAGGNERVEGFDVATWKFSNAMAFFNTGDFEGCGPKGFVSLTLNGQGDEARLKQATLAIVRRVVQKM